MKKLCLSLLLLGSLAMLSLPVSADPVTAGLEGKLVSLQGQTVAKFDAAALAKAKFIAVYYSASWCGPCRRFTPQLVDWYNAHRASHANFELIFVSQDRSEADMEGYMKDDKMPWPALSFANIESTPALTHYMGPGIPCLVFLDDTGKVLSDSFDGDTYLGPDKVLGDIQRILDKNPASTTSGAGSAGNFDIFADKK